MGVNLELINNINITDPRSPLEWSHLFDSEDFKSYHYDGDDLGAIYIKDGTTFKVWAPTAQSVAVNLYQTGCDSQKDAGLIQTILMEREAQGIYSIFIKGDLEGTYYTYSINVGGNTEETGDPYGMACGINGQRSMVVDHKKTNPKEWDQDREFLKIRKNIDTPILYEVHIKDFSNDIHSGVRKEYRGKYLAFTEKNTTLDGNGQILTGVAYLKKLGVTHVHLLPFYDFGSIDESQDLENPFNWGYDPINYNIPEGSYSTNPYDGYTRIKECKEMIKALHDEGIAVVMDVVYNHTYDVQTPLQKTVPYYYYRLNENGDLANGSFCGNDTKSERHMFRKYMIDSVCYWAKEYHIDGFRFDLMGLHDVKTMNDIRTALDQLPEGESILMYGEPWTADYSPMSKGAKPATKENVELLDNRIAAFCDLTRDAIKGNVFIDEDQGFINGERGLENTIKHAVAAWCDEHQEEFKPKKPSQVISYVSAHDNFTLWDKLTCTLEKNENKSVGQMDFITIDPVALKQNRMAAGIYLTSLGIPFFQGGEEFARTKLGDDNSYQSSPILNQLDWRRMEKNKDLVEYYSDMIHLRKELKQFYAINEEMVSSITFHDLDIANTVAFSMEKRETKDCKMKEKNQESYDAIYVIYNSNPEKFVFQVPEGHWEQLSDGIKVINQNDKRIKVDDRIIVNDYAVVVLGRKQ